MSASTSDLALSACLRDDLQGARSTRLCDLLRASVAEVEDAPRVLMVRGAASDAGADLSRTIVVLDEPGRQEAASWLDAGCGDLLILRDADECARCVLARLQRWIEVDDLVAQCADLVVGESAALKRALRDLAEYAAFGRQPILLQGETGVGKELFAHLAHRLDPRFGAGPLRILDCSTIKPELSGSEFFGHERGAFTGAVASRTGAFAEADGGVLFLDEVGELPDRLQAELLRAVQEGAYQRVGGGGWLKSTFRLVCATHRDLEREVADETFRTDFYHRVAGCVCRIPALEARRDDILPLARRFVVDRLGAPAPLDPLLEAHLASRSYPGNVRELRQLVHDCLARYPGEGPVSIGCLPRREAPATEPTAPAWVEQRVRAGCGVNEICDEVKAAAYEAAIDEVGESTAAIAERLGVTIRTVQLQLNRRRATASNGSP